MKTFYNFIFLAFLCLNGYSQISTNVDLVYVNGQTNVTNCGTIDFGTTPNNSLMFYFTLTKPQSQAIGDGYLKIKLKETPSSIGNERGSLYITPSDWGDTQFIHTIGTNISATEVQVSGSSIYLEFTQASSPFTYYNSCEYPIGKTQVPTFTLSPSGTVYLVCGSSNPINFMVNNVYNSPGNLEYHWSIGNGWLDSNGNPAPATLTTTSNNITLTPIASPPGSVSVVPELDNTSYPPRTAIFGLVAYNPTNQITGNSSLCSTANYTVNNLPSGVSVSSWSVSDSSIASISTNGNQAILTATGNGTVSITANLTNVCGQTKPIVKNNIYVGAPDFSPYPAMSGENSPITGDYLWYSVGAASGANSYNWYFDVGNGVTGTSVGGWEILQYGYQNRSIYVKVGDPGSTVVVCKATNSCGNRIKYKYVSVRGANSPCEGELKFSSNPMRTGDQDNNVIYPPIDPCDFDPLGKMATNNKTIKTVEIFNSYGESVYLKSQTDDKFNVSELKKGLYIVKSQMPDGKTLTKKLIIQ